MPTGNRTLQRPVTGKTHSTRHPLHQMRPQSPRVQRHMPLVHGGRSCRLLVRGALVIGYLVVGADILLQGLPGSERLDGALQARSQVRGGKEGGRRGQRRREVAGLLLGGMVDLPPLLAVRVVEVRQAIRAVGLGGGLQGARRRLAAVEGGRGEIAEGLPGGAGLGRDSGPGREEPLELPRRDGGIPPLLAPARRLSGGRRGRVVAAHGGRAGGLGGGRLVGHGQGAFGGAQVGH